MKYERVNIMEEENSVTVKQAYESMFVFLEKWFDQTQNDEIAVLLGSMSTLEDGYPIDQGIWADWIEAIESVQKNIVNISINLHK
jgi:hypothetical protein